MEPEKPNTSGQANPSSVTISTGFEQSLLWIKGVASCVFWSSVRYIRNIPSKVKNKFLRWRNLQKRMPKRKTKNKVYVLIGYTSKKNVDRRYRAIKFQHMIRGIILTLIVIAFVFILYKWLDPLRNSEEYKQMIGISNMKDLTKDDPFGATGETSNIVVFQITDTPTPTTTPAVETSGP